MYCLLPLGQNYDCLHVELTLLHINIMNAMSYNNSNQNFNEYDAHLIISCNCMNSLKNEMHISNGTNTEILLNVKVKIPKSVLPV